MRRAKWGAGAAVVVGLAWLISNVFDFNGPGLGPGDGVGVGLPTRSTDARPTEPPLQSEPPLPSDSQAEPDSESDTQPVATITPPSGIGAGGIVEVLIDDRSYFLRRGSTEPPDWVAAEPDAIAGYAKQATGDETGIRVRVFRKPSARASAEEELIEILGQVGIKRSDVDLPERLVE